MSAPAALGAIQEVAIHTPDTTGYMKAGYIAIAAVFLLYGLYLWGRARRAR
ncbi:MAG: hypothetical protein WBS54_07580 [Acidobacteriota bacterium]